MRRAHFIIVVTALMATGVLLLLRNVAQSQAPVITQPYGVTSSNVSSTIAVTNTFQSLWTASTATTGRVSCAIQNKGAADPMYVYFGAIAGATIAKSVKLTTSTMVNCTVFGMVLKDQVSITGTSGDAFFAAQQ